MYQIPEGIEMVGRLCHHCGETVWGTNRGYCAKWGKQTSVTAGTALHGTRKPLQLWFSWNPNTFGKVVLHAINYM